MDFDDFDEDMPEEAKEMIRQQQVEYAKAYGAHIEAIDVLYDFVNGLDKVSTNAFLKILQSCSQDPDQLVFWAGYVRASRFHKFGTNPNPYTPKFEEADFQEEG
jgi:hypothetical protein